MGSQREKWYEVRGDSLWQISENDGHAYMRSGPQRIEILLSTVEEAKTAFPEELALAKGDRAHDPRG